jgi:pyruvate/2-oxoglutarate dehydrogenase complex dihydrolipoamide acyltransferase (E2) component
MAFVFPMPEIGEGVVEAEVTSWKVAVGDVVRVDQPLCDVTTDKATLEITSPRAGRVARLHAEPGQMIRVHTPLIELDEGAAVAAPATPAPAAAPSLAAVAPPAVAPAPSPVARPATASARTAPAAPRDADEPTKAAPAVRRRARELDVDVHAVPGSGPGGRVTQADLDAFVGAAGGAGEAVTPSAPLPIAPVALPQVVAAAEDQRVKIVGVRKRIAERMVQATQTAPHFTYVEEVDCTRLVEVRERLKKRAADLGVKLTFLPIFAKATSLALRDFPNVNAWMDTEAGDLVVKAHHHLGIACDTPTGLMVPVVRHVERKSILQVAREIDDVTGRARVGRATREELSGSTFTLTGVGNIGGVLATPILNLPEVGVLGINQIRKKPVVRPDDTIGVAWLTMLSPSFDHRVIDGAVGARFTARLKEILETPEILLVELA